MSLRNEHAEIRQLLSLYVAGALDSDEETRIMKHLAGCSECRAELERWQAITGRLRRLHTPQPSAALFARTRAVAGARLVEQAEQRQNQVVLLLLIFFSWPVTIASWPAFRFATGGFLSLLDIRFHQTWLIFAIFSAVTWLAGGSAAVLLSARRQQERRLAL